MASFQLVLSVLVLQLFAFVTISANLLATSNAYGRNLTKLQKLELDVISSSLNESLDGQKHACDSFFDYVCGKNKPLFSVLGNLPHLDQLIRLQAELENDPEVFVAKEKMLDFFISCNTRKFIEQCYRQTFMYFKPLFGYIIRKNHFDHEKFLTVLQHFLIKSESTENFRTNTIRLKLVSLKREFEIRNKYFGIGDLNAEFRSLRIYRDSYEHNLRNLELFRKRNSTYEKGIERTMLDWTLYVYQSGNKPMAYYYSTLTPHLWMTLYNTTERLRENQYFEHLGECLKLKHFVNTVGEARKMAVIYLKSFRHAWADYNDWIQTNIDIFAEENQYLQHHGLDQNRLFFTIYAQNFCDFGKEIAENVFLLGLKNNAHFTKTYFCAEQSNPVVNCF